MSIKVGKQFTELTVIEQTEKRAKDGSIIWKCLCSCGTYCEVISSKLTNNRVRSCGCQMRTKEVYIKRKVQTNPDAGWNQYYNQYIQNAKAKQLCFDLSKEEFKTICSLPCYYCNIEPQYNNTYYKPLFKKNKNPELAERNKHRILYSNGIDKIIPELGYIKNNIRPCCKACNVSKLDRSEEEFKEWAKRLAKHWAMK